MANNIKMDPAILTGIANKIRSKKGQESSIPVQQLSTQISTLPNTKQTIYKVASENEMLGLTPSVGDMCIVNAMYPNKAWTANRVSNVLRFEESLPINKGITNKSDIYLACPDSSYGVLEPVGCIEVIAGSDSETSNIRLSLAYDNVSLLVLYEQQGSNWVLSYISYTINNIPQTITDNTVKLEYSIMMGYLGNYDNNIGNIIKTYEQGRWNSLDIKTDKGLFFAHAGFKLPRSLPSNISWIYNIIGIDNSVLGDSGDLEEPNVEHILAHVYITAGEHQSIDIMGQYGSNSYAADDGMTFIAGAGSWTTLANYWDCEGEEIRIEPANQDTPNNADILKYILYYHLDVQNDLYKYENNEWVKIER